MKAHIEVYRQRPGCTQIKTRFQPPAAGQTAWGDCVKQKADELGCSLELHGSGEDAPVEPDVPVGEPAPSQADSFREQAEAERAQHQKETGELQDQLRELERQLAAEKAREREREEREQLSGVKPKTKPSSTF
jgi:hypothetical protein